MPRAIAVSQLGIAWNQSFSSRNSSSPPRSSTSESEPYCAEEVYPPANGFMNNSQMTNCNGYMQGLIPNNVQNVNNQTASTGARDTSEMINQTAIIGAQDTSLKRGKETYTGPAICQPMEVNIQNNCSGASTTWQSCDIMKQSLGSNDGQGFMLDSSWNSQSVK